MIVCSATAPVGKGTDTVYSEVRTSKQGTMNTQPLLLCDRNQVKKQETGAPPAVNICVSERISY